MRPVHRCLSLLLIALVWTSRAWAVDPALALDQQVVRNWGVDQGLPQGTVSAVAQSGEGYIWAATEEGFVRFDGTEFTVYDKATSPQIHHNMTTALLSARDGSLYAATYGGGLVQVNAGRARSWGVADGLPSDLVLSLYESGNGALWIGTRGGLAMRQTDGRIVTVAGADANAPMAVTALSEDWAGTLWIGTSNGVATWKDGRLTRHDTDGFPTGQIVAIRTTRDGSIWMGTRGEGLVRYRSGQFRTYTAADGLPSAQIGALYEDTHGTLWIGTMDRGLGRFRDERFDFNTGSVGIGNKSVSSILEDREGNLWIGSAQGLTRVTEGRVVSFTTAQGLSTDKVKTVTADPSGTLWVGSGKGIQTLGGRHLQKGRGISSDMVMTAWSGRDGSLWVGTFDGGVDRVFQGKTTTWNTARGLRSNVVLSLYEDRGGVMWVGTAAGLQRIVNGKLAPDVYKLSGEVVGVIYEDRSGTLWAGTQDGGLNRIASGGVVTSFPKGKGPQSDFILALHEDNSGALWVGTFGGGLSRYKGGRWTTVTTREGLFDDSIFSILEDGNGVLWMSCNKGIFRVSRQQLDDFAEGLQPRVNSIAYGRADGMQSRECNGGTQPVAWKTPDGKLWFATVKGLAMIDPNRARAAAPPPVVIQDIFADRTRMDPSGKVSFPAGTKSLEFRYTAINLSAPEKLHYQYMLEGFDKEWVDAGRRRQVSYTNLAPGSYRFQIRAAIDDGPWSTGTMVFRQRAFFWQSPWFIVGCVLLLAACIVAAFRAKMNLVRTSAERFKLLFDRNPAGEYRANAAGGILDCNDACAKMFGFSSRAELMAHGVVDLYGSELEWETMVARLKDQGALASVETLLRRADGSDIWVLMNASAVTDGKGHPIVAATLVDITDRKRIEEEVRYRAHHDLLTGLPNRALFRDRLSIALNYAHRQNNQLAVLALDLDRFSVVNEAFGRDGGDEILREVAERVKACVREEDSVARVGDDEFTLLLMKPANVGDVIAVARKILQSVAQPMTIEGNEFNITTSIGIAFFPQDGADADALLRDAGGALCRAKEAGRNSYQLSSPFLARKATERLTLETALHQALERHEFVLHYQPQLDLRTQTVTGMEALIRWDRGGKSMLRPAEFIGVAEDTRLILPIGEWAIEEACRQGQAWFSEGTGMRMAVNVSARQFQQPNVVSMIRDAVERSGFDPRFLEIEITESTAMEDPDLTADILLDLKSLGMTIALDDFGVGHSSLNYLKRFPIDALKIDRSFVQDITRGGSDGAIVSAVIAMGRALNIRVIAEGVETPEQLTFLQEHGCNEFQGYLFGRPMSASALTEMIHTATPGAYTRRYARSLHAAASNDH